MDAGERDMYIWILLMFCFIRSKAINCFFPRRVPCSIESFIWRVQLTYPIPLSSSMWIEVLRRLSPLPFLLLLLLLLLFLLSFSFLSFYFSFFFLFFLSFPFFLFFFSFLFSSSFSSSSNLQPPRSLQHRPRPSLALIPFGSAACRHLPR